MKKINLFLGIICLSFFVQNLFAQALPMNRYSINRTYVIDMITQKPSFAFSSRKLRASYTGFALRVRRSVDNAEADIAFDSGIVTDNSVVTIAVSGTSGLAVGSTTTLATFRSAKTLYVSIWYDQGLNGYNGVQTTTSRQAVYTMASAGGASQYPSLVFTGTSKHCVVVNQPLTTLLGAGIRGGVYMVSKVLAGSSTNNSFGYSDAADNNKRWSAHMNWPSDNNMYTDFGSSTDVSRNFLNSSSLGIYKQYAMYRNATNKTVRLSGVIKTDNVLLNTLTVTWSAGSTFGVGLTTGSLDTQYGQNGITGNIPEFILYPEALTTAQGNLVELNQINFWGAF